MREDYREGSEGKGMGEGHSEGNIGRESKGR